jgi:hypothetical protein
MNIITKILAIELTKKVFVCNFAVYSRPFPEICTNFRHFFKLILASSINKGFKYLNYSESLNRGKMHCWFKFFLFYYNYKWRYILWGIYLLIIIVYLNGNFTMQVEKSKKNYNILYIYILFKKIRPISLVLAGFRRI